MPYNTRRKSLSLPSLGIHVPMTAAARAAHNASKSARLSESNSSTSSTSPRSSSSRSRSPDSHPSKRLKQSHSGDVDPIAVETTPPPSPTPATSVDMDAESQKKVDLEGINDDIVEAVITELQATENRPHLIKDLAIVLARSLKSVQKYVPPLLLPIDFFEHRANHTSSANPCAIISSRLASYMKRPCWSALAPCPLAKELETVHPRRTYYFLTTIPRQPLPESGSVQSIARVADITPSVSLTDDSGSDELEERRRQLSPSPEIDLPRYDFNDADEMPMTPVGSLPKPLSRGIGELPHDLPPLETDEREFSQTADTLLKRKFNEAPEEDRSVSVEYGTRDDLWFGDSAAAAFLTSPAMRPSVASSSRKEDEAENWIKLNKLFAWDQNAGAESIEIDELDGLMEGC